MRPLTMIAGILLGSALAISIGLAVVLFLFLLLGDAYPQLETEWPALVRASMIFTGLTGICALGFFGLVKNRGWRHAALLAEGVAVCATILYYWP